MRERERSGERERDDSRLGMHARVDLALNRKGRGEAEEIDLIPALVPGRRTGRMGL